MSPSSIEPNYTEGPSKPFYEQQRRITRVTTTVSTSDRMGRTLLSFNSSPCGSHSSSGSRLGCTLRHPTGDFYYIKKQCCCPERKALSLSKSRHRLHIFFNTTFVSSHMYPENPEGTQVIVGSMNMGYISDTARNRTPNLFRPKRESIPLGHSDGRSSQRITNLLNKIITKAVAYSK